MVGVGATTAGGGASGAQPGTQLRSCGATTSACGVASATIASRLLRRPRVRKALRERVEGDPLVAGRIERLHFLTRVMRGQEMVEHIKVGKRGRRSKMKEPPTLRERMEAAKMLREAAGEHLPVLDDAGEGNKAAGQTLERLMAIMMSGGTVQ